MLRSLAAEKRCESCNSPAFFRDMVVNGVAGRQRAEEKRGNQENHCLCSRVRVLREGRMDLRRQCLPGQGDTGGCITGGKHVE
eukprot:725588-Rhodomonas_salina.1